MTRRTPEQELEQLLETDRGRFGAIYDRLSRAEPPRRLDRAVIGEATRAALGHRAPKSQSWMLGLGSAAGIVLAAGIAWQVGRQMDAREALPPAEAAKSSAPLVVPVDAISLPEPQAERVPGGPPHADAGKSDLKSKVAMDSEVRTRRAAKPSPLPTPPPAPTAAARAAPAIMQAPAADMTIKSEADVDAAKKEQAASEQAIGGVAGSVGNAASGASEYKNEMAPARAERSRQTLSAPAPTTSTQLRRNMQLAPQDWIAEIVRLRREGRHQQAIENIRLFQRMHPDWQLDEDLRRLAE